MFTLSTQKKKFPDKFKTSHLKSGNISQIENFPSITILFTISKFFEEIVYNIIYSRVLHILIDEQHGIINKVFIKKLQNIFSKNFAFCSIQLE